MSKEVNKKKDLKKKSNKGFSLVELLAVIVIVGTFSVFAIAGVNRYISSARSEKVSQNRKNVAMAAEMYLQSNRNLLPQNIGDHTRIPLSVLRSSNYLKEDVTNEKGENCMEESLVRVYKFDEDDYSYTTYLYCGDEKAPEEDDVPQPVVTNFKYSSNKGDVRTASFSFTMKGAKDDDTVGIYSYRYIISVKNSSDGGENYREIFNSEYLKGGLEPTINITSKSLSNYIDLTGYTLFKVDVDVINEQGGKIEWSGSEALGAFEDNDPPICGNVYGNDPGDNDWINKASFGAGSSISDGKRVYPGRVSVECSDGNGSGCKRDLFTKTWPNDEMSDSGKVNYKYGARWGYVTISDNAVNSKNGNNETKCYVRVNVDVQAPSVKLYVYNASTYESDRKSPESKAVASATAADSEKINAKAPEATIDANSIKNVQGVDNEKWLNAANYPNGIIIDAEVTDNLYLYRWTWEVNDAYVAGGSSSNTVSSTYNINNSKNENGSKYEGYFSTNLTNGDVTNDEELAREELGDTSGSISGLKLYLEGKRYGRLTVYDKAGNATIIHVYANIDRTAPAVPTVSYLKQSSKTGYTPASADNYLDHNNWSNEKLYAYVAEQRTDHEAPNNKGTELSGWHKFTYSYSKQTGKSGNNLTWAAAEQKDATKVYDFGIGIELNDEGTHKVQYRSCDKAGNCSAYNTIQYPKIDTVKPTCTIVSKDNNGKPNAAGWYKAGQSVTLSHSCSDKDDKFSSGCNETHDSNKASHTYDYDINTTTAGVGGNNSGGYVYDYAGNRSDECPKNATVKVDTVKPTCTVKATYTGTTGPNAAGWLKIGETVTLTHPCTDPTKNGVASGCDTNNAKNKQSFAYTTDINTTKAGANGDGKGGTVMDIAGNESETCPVMTVKIDHTAPTCTTNITYSGTLSSSGWLGIGETATVSKVCTENSKNGVSSGCDNNRSDNKTSYLYNKEISTSTAGAGGNGNSGGKVYDVAGNASAECPKNKTVKIDYTNPTCTVKITSGSVNGSTYSSSAPWTNQSLYITAQCSDSSGSAKSGCQANRTLALTSDMDTTIYFNSTNNTNYSYVIDNADNKVFCSSSHRVRIDKTAPKVYCSTSGSYYTNDNSNNLAVYDSGSYDPTVNGARSDIKTRSYNLDGSNMGSTSSKRLSCQSYARNASGIMTVTDNAGNSTTVNCGSVYVPGCCDSQSGWYDGNTCSSQCGWSGTYNRYTVSNYNSSTKCQIQNSGGSACNRRDCCSSTYSWGNTGCYSSSGCGTGSTSVYKYSNYDGSYCGTETASCDTGVSCKKDIDPSKCGMWISRKSGSTAYFSSNGTCDISSVSGGSWSGGSTVTCTPKCTVKVTWTSGVYTFNGKDYAYTSWTTLKCSDGRFCTSNCPSSACVG